MQLPIDVLRAAVIGLLIEDGYEEARARALAEATDIGPITAKAMRRVASVALTLQAHGLMKDSVH